MRVWFGANPGTATPSYQNRGAVVEPEWKVVGATDLNSDGRADILWRHTSGAFSSWRMDGATFMGDSGRRELSPGWKLLGVLHDAKLPRGN